MHVGYMYQSNQVHGLTSSSTIKGVLDQWYQNNLLSVSDKIDGNAGFCGDRQPSTSTSTINNSGGTGRTETYYGAFIRVFTNKQPTFECSNSSDLYTTIESEQGNKVLTYPIGLITADEVAYAGGVYGLENKNYYLYTGQYYWTMSPSSFDNYNFPAEFLIADVGNLGNWRVMATYGIRPVINLRADVAIQSGNGTSTSPYIIS